MPPVVVRLPLDGDPSRRLVNVDSLLARVIDHHSYLLGPMPLEAHARTPMADGAVYYNLPAHVVVPLHAHVEQRIGVKRAGEPDAEPAAKQAATQHPAFNPESPFAVLPDEVLLEIIMQTPLADMPRIALVNRRFRELATDPVRIKYAMRELSSRRIWTRLVLLFNSITTEGAWNEYAHALLDAMLRALEYNLTRDDWQASEGVRAAIDIVALGTLSEDSQNPDESDYVQTSTALIDRTHWPADVWARLQSFGARADRATTAIGIYALDFLRTVDESGNEWAHTMDEVEMLVRVELEAAAVVRYPRPLQQHILDEVLHSESWHTNIERAGSVMEALTADLVARLSAAPPPIDPAVWRALALDSTLYFGRVIDTLVFAPEVLAQHYQDLAFRALHNGNIKALLRILRYAYERPDRSAVHPQLVTALLQQCEREHYHMGAWEMMDPYLYGPQAIDFLIGMARMRMVDTKRLLAATLVQDHNADNDTGAEFGQVAIVRRIYTSLYSDLRTFVLACALVSRTGFQFQVANVFNWQRSVDERLTAEQMLRVVVAAVGDGGAFRVCAEVINAHLIAFYPAMTAPLVDASTARRLLERAAAVDNLDACEALLRTMDPFGYQVQPSDDMNHEQIVAQVGALYAFYSTAGNHKDDAKADRWLGVLLDTFMRYEMMDQRGLEETFALRDRMTLLIDLYQSTMKRSLPPPERTMTSMLRMIARVNRLHLLRREGLSRLLSNYSIDETNNISPRAIYDTLLVCVSRDNMADADAALQLLVQTLRASPLLSDIEFLLTRGGKLTSSEFLVSWMGTDLFVLRTLLARDNFSNLDAEQLRPAFGTLYRQLLALSKDAPLQPRVGLYADRRHMARERVAALVQLLQSSVRTSRVMNEVVASVDHESAAHSPARK